MKLRYLKLTRLKGLVYMEKVNPPSRLAVKSANSPRWVTRFYWIIALHLHVKRLTALVLNSVPQPGYPSSRVRFLPCKHLTCSAALTFWLIMLHFRDIHCEIPRWAQMTDGKFQKSPIIVAFQSRRLLSRWGSGPQTTFSFVWGPEPQREKRRLLSQASYM